MTLRTDATVTSPWQTVTVDATTAGSLSELRRLCLWVGQSPRRSVVVDFREVDEACNPTVLSLLAAASGRARATGSAVSVMNVPASSLAAARAVGVRRTEVRTTRRRLSLPGVRMPALSFG